MTSVFISSTSKDLEKYRQAAIDICLRLKLFPIGMEQFEAMGVGATAGSKRKLDDANLYVGIFAHRYGYVEEGYDRSVTEIEFDYAGERKLDRLCFVVDPKHPWPQDAVDHANHAQLEAFIEKRVNKLIRAQFTDENDFSKELMQALGEWQKQHPVEELPAVISASSSILAHDPDDLMSEKPRKLIGRDDLLKEVSALLESGERVLLQGFSGMGKTAVAATLAANWLRDGNNPVIWFKAGNSEINVLFEALTRGIDKERVKDIARETGEAKISAIRHLLRLSGAKLLVLDDCWNGAALYTFLKAVPSNIPVLITSRQHYPLEGKVRDVGELSPADALALLSYHADQDFSTDSKATELCQRVGNHTFALEIAGKTLKAQKWLPFELLSYIKDAPHDLELPMGFSEHERRSVKDLLDASLSTLDDKAQSVFKAFGAFFVPKLTEEMLKLHKWRFVSISKSLETLKLYGLIDEVPATHDSIAYYRLHVLAYSYARSKNNTSQRERALDACVMYLNKYSESSAKDIKSLLPELGNCLAAANWALDAQRYKDVENVARALTAGSKSVIELLGYVSEEQILYQQALFASEKSGNRRGKGAWLGNLGNTYRDLGQYEQAIEYHEQALAISREIKDQLNEGIWLGNLGTDYHDLGQYEQAIEYHEQALAIIRETTERQRENLILGNLGNDYTGLGQHKRAIEHHQQALIISRETKDHRSEGINLGNLGVVYGILGQNERAIEYHQQALIISRETKDHRSEGIDLGNLGDAYHALGNDKDAVNHYQQAITIAREIKHRRGEATWLSHLANVYRDKEDYDQASDLYRQSRTMFEDMHLPHEIEIVDKEIAEAEAKRAAATGDSPQP